LALVPLISHPDSEMISTLKKQSESAVQDSVAGIESVGHWLEDKMQKRIYDFHEGSRNDQSLLGLKGLTHRSLSLRLLTSPIPIRLFSL
jgi:hypothetical protein